MRNVTCSNLTRALGCLLLGLISACTTTTGEQKVQPVAEGQHLCLDGREIVRVSQTECAAQQARRQAGQSGVSDILDDLTLEYSPDELHLSLLQGIVFGAGYKYRVEPSYRPEYFTRIDSYRFRVGAAPGDLLGNLPLRISFNRNAELVFAQQFADGPTARSPLSTYTPLMTPLSADKALGLKVGDYVRFNTAIGLLANTGQVWPLAGYLLRANTGISMLLEGEYQVHVFRQDGSRVRIKLIAERAREGKVQAGVSAAPLVKMAVLSRVSNELLPLTRLVDLDVWASLAASKTDSDLFMIDYTLDLSRPEAIEAYNRIFQSEVILRDVKISNPLQGQFALRDRLVSSIEEVDLLARRDRNSDNPAVIRHFKGSNYSDTQAVNFRVKLSTFEVQRSRIYRENFLTRNTINASGGDDVSYFLLPTWNHVRDRNMLFGMLNEDMNRSADALFIADNQGKPVRFMNIGFGFDYRDARQRPSEYQQMRRKIELLLPHEAELLLAERMQGTGWLDANYRRNLYVSLRYFFREQAFDLLVAKGYGEPARHVEALTDFITTSIIEKEYTSYTDGAASFVRNNSTLRASPDPVMLAAATRALVAAKWQTEIATTARRLARGFAAGDNIDERMDAILRLRNSAFYQPIGPAYWAYLIDRSEIDLKEVMYFSLELTADDMQGIDFAWGDPGERELYESARFIQSVLNDRSLDMREPGDLDSVISKMIIVGN